jgi:hypothetical protein
MAVQMYPNNETPKDRKECRNGFHTPLPSKVQRFLRALQKV